MKTHTDVSSSRRKQRRAHFSAPSHIRRRLMSSSLSKDLRKKYNVRSLPIKRGDEVTIATGKHKGSKGKVTSVYRKRWVIHIEKITRMKANGASQQIPIQPSNVIIIKPQLSKDRRDLLERKAARGKGQKGKGEKHTAETTKKN